MTNSRLVAACGLMLSSFAVVAVASSPASDHGVRTAHVDSSVAPCDDFYRFANGAWLGTAQIPAEYPAWGVPQEMYERNLAQIRELLEQAAKDAPSASDPTRRKVGDFYAAAMDEARLEALGVQPLTPRLERIDKLATLAELAAELAELQALGVRAAFDFGVGIDEKKSDSYIAQLSQGGLGLPDRDYYTREDERATGLRTRYLAHVARMLGLLGAPAEAAQAQAATILALETRLARASMTLVEQRNPQALYNKLTRAALRELAPDFPWAAYFAAVELPAAQQELLVRQPAFFRELGAMAKDVPLADWKTYLRWHLIHATAPELGARFVDENFDFYGRALRGVTQLSPRWKRVQASATAALGEAVGRLYVERAFSPEAKAQVLELVRHVQAELRERIARADWMSEPTRQQAYRKLDALIVKIGYPDAWRDYGALPITRDAHLENVLAARRFEARRNLAKLGQPVDRSEWLLRPHELNAYYEPTTNEMCYTAAILQSPIFDPQADRASNYGGIGVIIGHELTHGFDDQGSQFDADGNLREWWTAADRQAFKERQAAVVEQYAAYKPFPDQAINGELTLGENIADIAGVRVSFHALRRSFENEARPAAIDGYSLEQRFFLAYAQTWRRLVRPERLRMQLNTDPHSPAEFRVIGPLSNLSEFHEAFACSAGAAMVRPKEKRPAIW